MLQLKTSLPSERLRSEPKSGTAPRHRHHRPKQSNGSNHATRTGDNSLISLLNILSKLILDYFKQHNADKNSDLRPSHGEYHISDSSAETAVVWAGKRAL